MSDVNPYRDLAECIRNGSQGLVQVEGVFFFEKEYDIIGCCAIGAAIIEKCRQLDIDIPSVPTTDTARQLFPILSEYVPDPDWNMEEPLLDVITHMNDNRCKPFDEIADFVETLGGAE